MPVATAEQALSVDDVVDDDLDVVVDVVEDLEVVVDDEANAMATLVPTPTVTESPPPMMPVLRYLIPVSTRHLLHNTDFKSGV